LRPSGYGERIAAFQNPLPERTGQQRKLLALCVVQAKDEDMRDFRDAKAMAHTLRAALAAKDLKITTSQSLELIAKAFGAADWNTLSAAIRADTPAPRANASPPSSPTTERVPEPRFSATLETTLHRALAHANQRKHQYATLEHLLLALTDDMDASAVLKACNVGISALKDHLTSYIDNELKKLVIDDGGEAKPTAAFQRVVPRAVLQAQRLGRPTVSGAELLVAIFAERQSPGVLLLLEQAMTSYDAVNFVAHGIAKGNGVEAV
jgi:Glyoxalase superfamily protein/Clp amino terminal domain, pathogenicity island component